MRPRGCIFMLMRRYAGCMENEPLFRNGPSELSPDALCTSRLRGNTARPKRLLRVHVTSPEPYLPSGSDILYIVGVFLGLLVKGNL